MTPLVLSNILGWYNPRTNKFEYGLNPKRVWYNMMGEEIVRYAIFNLKTKPT
jgi:hypothetical protein